MSFSQQQSSVLGQQTPGQVDDSCPQSQDW